MHNVFGVGEHIMDLNYYDVLGVPKHATDEQIKTAYRKLAMQHHPDRNDNSKLSEEIFKNVQVAYEHLSNPTKRQQHDEFLMTGRMPISEDLYQPPMYQTHSYTTDSRYAQDDVKGRGIIQIMKKWWIFLILIFCGVFYFFFISIPHTNSLNRAVPAWYNELDPNKLHVNAQIKVLSSSDHRIDDAMTQIYGQNFIQTTTVTCWLSDANMVAHAATCMQPYSAFLVTTDDGELLYLQMIERGAYQKLAQNEKPSGHIIFSAAIVDLMSQEIIVYKEALPLSQEFNALGVVYSPIRISCNGAFAWPSTFNSKQAALYAQNGSDIVNVFQILPPQYLDRSTYTHRLVPTSESCVYDLHIEKRVGGEVASIAIAVFDPKLWAYRMP